MPAPTPVKTSASVPGPERQQGSSAKKWPASVCLSLWLFLGWTLPVRLAAAEAPTAGRVLRVKAVADEAFRDNDKWEKEIREHFAWADPEFRKMTGIGLQLVAVDRWTTHESQSMPLLLEELRVKIDKGDADVVVGFTGHKPPELSVALMTGEGTERFTIRLPFIAGIAMPFGDRVVVRRDEDKRETRHTLLHEISHLFGGVHVKDKSVLYSTNERTDFVLDPFNQKIFNLTRQRDFQLDVHDLPREQLDQLVALYREAPLRHERDFDTNIRVAYLLLAAGEVDAAIKELETAIDIDPAETNSILRGFIIPELETYAEEHGSSSLTRYTLGRAYTTVREWGRAAQQFYPNCYNVPPHAPSCSELGASLIQSKAFQPAEQALLRALELDESQVNAHNNLGILYSAVGRTADAMAHFNRAIELHPDDAGVYYNMGMAYLQSDHLEPAADAFRHAMELEPQNDPARSRLALTLARLGQTKQARELIKEFEKRQQLPALVVRDLAEICFRDGDSKRAWKYLGLAKKAGWNVTELEQEMLAGTPKPRQVKTSDLVEQAAAYYDEKRYDVALNLLEQARTQQPDEEEVYYWLGRVARAQGKPDEASQQLQYALQLKPKYAEPHLELARLASDRKDFAGAASHLNHYIDLADYPDSEAYYLLGWAQLELGNLPGAEYNAKKAIQGDPDYGNAFYLLATVYTRQERKEEAVAELNLAINSRSLRADLRPQAHYNLAVLSYQTRKYDQAWKHVHIAQRLGYADVASLIEDLRKVAPDSDQNEEEEPAEPVSAGQPAVRVGPQQYRIRDAVIGEPPGTVRSGRVLRGRVHLVRGAQASGRVVLSIRIGATSTPFWNYWLFTFPEVPEGQDEKEVVFTFGLPPQFPAQGEFRGILAVVSPQQMPAGGGVAAMPTVISNEIEVKFRVIP